MPDKIHKIKAKITYSINLPKYYQILFIKNA
jgi:hypothetical protein